MGKLNFLMKAFHLGSIKTLFEIRKEVKKKTDKKFVLLDMCYCSLKYQASFHDYIWFDFYDLNAEQRSTYLTRGKNNEIIKTFNKQEYWHMFDNKTELVDTFKEFLHRDYLKPNSTKQQYLDFINGKDKIIVKPNDGEGGIGIEIVDTKDETVYEKYKGYLMEELIKQHHLINEIYDKSVNSLRMFTFYNSDDDIVVIQSVIKFGNNKVVDNFCSGGMYAFLDDDGNVVTPAVDRYGNEFINHPLTNKPILGFKVPNYEQAKAIIKEAAKKVPQVRYIGWDVAITEEGASLIEGNTYPSIFQRKPKFAKDKIGEVPYLESILKIKLH